MLLAKAVQFEDTRVFIVQPSYYILDSRIRYALIPQVHLLKIVQHLKEKHNIDCKQENIKQQYYECDCQENDYDSVATMEVTFIKFEGYDYEMSFKLRKQDFLEETSFGKYLLLFEGYNPD